MAQRYYISQFDGDTYQIVDAIENREVCVCSNYDGFLDAEERAGNIAKLLNDKEEEFQKIQSFVNLMSLLKHK
ncbi:MAG: hypothetical protein ACOYZ8_19680 [Chloroflexota bacterium]